jgi:invasin-like protein
MSISLLHRVLLQRCGLLLALLSLTAAAFGSNGSLALRATPEVVRADGHSTTTITAEVRDSGGGIVPDGTPVHFTTTTGQIDAVAPTVGGRARATFTSDALAGVAQVSAFAGTASATISVRMAEDPNALTPRSRVLTVHGKYVAYSESLGVLEAIGDARLTWKDQTITAQAVQADLFNHVIRAQDGVRIETKKSKKSVTGDRLALDMTGDVATLIGGDTRQVLDFLSLAPLAGKRISPNPLEWADLNNSDVLWVAEEAIAVPGQKVQLRKAAAFLGGQRVLRLPYHEVSLAGGLSPQGQSYVGVGSEGLTVDLPYVLKMSPSESTSLHLQRGNRSGFGWYGTNPDWQLNLERQYGLPGATEGMVSLGWGTAGDYGLHWNHTQQLAKGTQAYALLESPRFQDLYSNLNLSRQGRLGTLGLNISAQKVQARGLSRTIDLNASTAPHPLAGTGLKLSLESRVYDSRGGDYVTFDGKQYVVAPSFSRELGVRLTPAMLKLGRGGLSSWVSLRQVWGSRDQSGFGLAGALAFNHPIGKMGGLSLNYSYNRFPGNTFYGTAGRQNLSASLRLAPTRRLSMGVFGSVGLDSPTRTMNANATYSFGPLWRLEVQQTAYSFPNLSESDLQFGLSRALGQRDLKVYWSTLRRRIMFEVGSGSF